MIIDFYNRGGGSGGVTTGEVQTMIDNSISGKQNTLISGTNIKSINSQSILGEGDMTIDSGGEKVVELTMDEYTALTGYASSTTYVITDAEYINIDDYAKTTAVTASLSNKADTSAVTASLSAKADTSAVTQALLEKADKATVIPNTGRVFPRWNSQGIITGETGNTVYEQSLNINGVSKDILQTTNSSFGNIYAPTTAGSAAQPLLSNGSGAPVWASFKMWKGNQSQYDAITTKDNDTIYFVTDD